MTDVIKYTEELEMRNELANIYTNREYLYSDLAEERRQELERQLNNILPAKK